MPQEDGQNSDVKLAKLCHLRLARKFNLIDSKIIHRLEYELGVIKENQFSDYFLVVNEIVNFAREKAIDIINSITEDAEIGKIYLGKVKKILDFGAFVEILPGTEGLLHISQISDKRVGKVTDEMSEGDNVLVKVIEKDKLGKIRLSRKEALRESKGEAERESRSNRDSNRDK